MEKNKDFLKWIKTRPEQKAYLFSTETEFSYEDYVEDCEQRDITPGKKGSIEQYKWETQMRQDYYENDRDNIRHSKYGKDGVVLTGAIGRWNGRFPIKPVIYPTLDEALTAISGGDILDVEASYTTKCIEVTAKHHDFSNCFCIWLLKKNCNEYTLQDRIDNGTFDPESAYEKRFFIDKITDFII